MSSAAAIQFRKLSQKIIKDPKNLQNLPKLIKIFKQNATTTTNGIVWLQRIFVHFNGKISFLNNASASDDNKGAVWMKQQYAQFESILMGVLQQKKASPTPPSTALLHDAIKCLLFFAALQNHSIALYKDILFALLCEDMTQEQRSIFIAFVFEMEPPVSNNALRALAEICRYSATQISAKNDEASNDNNHNTSASTMIARFTRNLLQLLLDVSAEVVGSNHNSSNAQAPANKKRKLMLSGGNGNDSDASTQQQQQQRSNFVGMAWLNFLSVKHLSIGIYHTILSRLDSDIFAVFKRGNTCGDNNNLLLLADFLTDSYNIGGEISMLSLKALFTLIHSYNLDYPHFYERLYGKLHANIFFSRNATKFFQLLSLFLLKSDYIPQYLVVAFMKRLSRMSLFAPPHGVIFIVNIVRDLLRKYPAVRFLVDKSKKSNQGLMDAMTVNTQQKLKNAAMQLQKEEMKDKGGEDEDDEDHAVESGEDGIGRDPFDYECLDPKQCRANESSLWELKSLINHFEYKTSRHCFETVTHFQQQDYHMTNINKSHMFQYHKLLNYYFMKNEKSMKSAANDGGDKQQNQTRFRHKKKSEEQQEKKKYNTHDISVERSDHLFSSQSLFTDVFAI